MSYDVKDLQVLSPVDHVRLRKSMYIGEAFDPSPLFNEIIDNALDEQNAGYSPLTKVEVDYQNNIYKVTDFGRGFPQGKIKNPETGKETEALELLCTTAFSGGKFGGTGGYRIVSGIHGLGILVTNSLSKSYITKTWRDGQLIEYSAQQGRTKSLIYNNISEGTPSGTEVIFSPDPEIFSEIKIPLSHILMRCKVASAFGMKNVLKVRKEDSDEFEEISTESDIFDLLPEEDEGISEYYRHSFDVFDPDTGEHASVALKYTSDTKEYSRGYTNLLYNSQGGSHIKMLDSAVYDAWAHFNVPDIKWNDIYLGLRGVISVFITHTEFSSQSKERLTVNKTQLDKLKSLITQEIIKWLTDNEEIRLSLIKRFQEYRVSQDKLLARKEIKSLLYVNNSKGGQVRRSSVVRKLRDCDSKSKEGTELFIIEGDSACFTGDTEVRLSNNQTLTFEELVSLNLSEINVYSLDIPRSNFISTKASDIRITRLTNRIIKIGLSDGSFVKCTVDHLFYNSILKDWVRADSLVIGDSLLSADNLQVSHKTITSIENIEYESSIPVYCMTVEGTHNFMLANGLIVHNCGSGLSARNTRTQALLPIRGKVFNVARCADPKEALSNEETRSIINAIGAGIMDQADPDKSRYERIIFMTDSDFDGAEIAVLLSGLFINLLAPLVKAGMIYVALPPLYGWEDKDGLHFANKLSEIPEKILLSKNFSRYKGLGEMSTNELWDSTMNPDTRRLIRLNYPEDVGMFNSILTSSGVKYQMLVDQGVIKEDN